MNDVKIARLTGVFGLACVALTFGQFPLWLVGSPPSVYDGREFAQHLFDIKRVAFTRILMDQGIYASMLIFAAGLRHLVPGRQRDLDPPRENHAPVRGASGLIEWRRTMFILRRSRPSTVKPGSSRRIAPAEADLPTPWVDVWQP